MMQTPTISGVKQQVFNCLLKALSCGLNVRHALLTGKEYLVWGRPMMIQINLDRG
ncbi:hypothetical protein C7431_101754 [Pantoea allii]|uniref:Uncharacterized protein n=1 Tax=Pantoea allii TaxID=574096 RepID=A0A2V2BNQ5_9GAMM|nr:hypothetical protein C7431_101754 [Pantoea allii]TWD41925.1 hypothetical protein FBY13_104284 [Pantoea sp. SJZ147]